MNRVMIRICLTAVALSLAAGTGAAASSRTHNAPHCPTPPRAGCGPTRFAVFSDPHFFDSSLGTTGAAFEAYLARDRKMIRESEALVDAAIDSIIAQDVDFVIIPGDLTKDGELRSHLKFARALMRLKARGIACYVVPGNHDINNPESYAYSGETQTPTPNVSPALFRWIYRHCGYQNALAQDSHSLSYVAEPAEGLWLLALDSCDYDDNETLGHSATGGRFKPETLSWIQEQLAQARTRGKRVMAMMHHGLMEHYTGQTVLFGDYVIDDWQTLSQTLAGAGLPLIFTGHFHANDIVSRSWDIEGRRVSLTDVETGSLVTFPSPVRFVTVCEGGCLDIETDHITEIDFDTQGVPFPEYAAAYLYEGLYGLAMYQLTVDFGLPVDQAVIIAPFIADAFMAHYAGDESPDAATLGFIQALLATPDPTVQLLGQSLYSLWTDLPPADGAAVVCIGAPRPTGAVALSPIGAYSSGVFAEGAAEIVAYDAKTRRLFVNNGFSATIDILSIADPSAPAKIGAIDVTPYGAVSNSVAAHDGLIAVAVENASKQAPGKAVFFDAHGQFLAAFDAGALPDMITFSPDGRTVLVANEGEPNDDYSVDPEGSITLIDLACGLRRARAVTLDFSAYNDQAAELKSRGIRLFGPGATVAQDLEPEFIAVSADSRYAYVTCQENNAVAQICLRSKRIVNLAPLGYKDHGQLCNSLDPSDKDGGIGLVTCANLMGMLLPDAIAAHDFRGRRFILTANEGDARDYDGFSEEARVKDAPLDPIAFPQAAELKNNARLGRLKITNTMGDDDGDGDFDRLFCFGGRSFSVYEQTCRGLKRVFDSGDQFERIVAEALPQQFNSDNDKNGSFDSRSDDKGPEPEGLTLGRVEGRDYAFIGLERIGGVMVYDVTNPECPRFVCYVNNRDFSGNAQAGTAGDLGPEGLLFIPKNQSPIRKPLLVVANEVSGTTTIYRIDAANAH